LKISGVENEIKYARLQLDQVVLVEMQLCKSKKDTANLLGIMHKYSWDKIFLEVKILWLKVKKK